MKYIFKFPVILLLSFAVISVAGNLSVDAKEKKTLFVDRINVSGLPESEGREIENYIAQNFIESGKYILLSRSSLEQGLQPEDREKISGSDYTGDLLREVLMRSAVVDYMVYGSYVRENEYIYLTLKKIRKGAAKTKPVRMKTVRYRDRKNTVDAANLISIYLISGREGPVRAFQDKVNVEDKLYEKRKSIGEESRSDAEREDDFMALVSQHKKDREKSIRSGKPFMRLGFSMHDNCAGSNEFNDYFDRGPLFMGEFIRPDILPFVDIYGRYTYEKIYKRDADTSPDCDKLEDMWKRGDMVFHMFDAGFRLRAGTFMLMNRIDLYLLAAGRYELDGGKGYYTGGGLEVTLWKHAGLFAEYNFGVFKPSDPGIDIGYSRLLFGMTLRL